MDERRLIRIHKVDEATCTVECSDRITEEMKDYFTCYAPNYRFHPKYKARQWDGKLRFISYDKQIPIGLCEKIEEFAAKGKYNFKYEFQREEKILRSDFNEFVLNLKITDDNGNPMEPRDYQLEAAYDALTKKVLNISSTTSSGKSLILYIIVRWLVEHDERILCIFPTTQLVEQIYSDFESYGWEDLDSYCCMIYSGKKRLIERQVHLATWQSIASMTKASYNELLASYTGFIQDEAHNHSGSSKVLSSLSKRCINAHYRIGTSGSFPDKDTADWFSVVGATGSIKVYSTYKKLQEAGYISDLKINVIRLNYHIDIKTENYNTNVKGKDGVEAYNLETEFINNHPLRNEFISKLLNSVKGNSLVLVSKVEQHGIPLYTYLKQKLPNKNVMYIDGSIPVHERELIRKRIELEDGCVLVATFATLSTGISIKRLHNVIFAAGTKSRSKTIQSAGRGMRLYKDKKYMQLFDLVDDLSFVDKINDIKYINYSVKHYKERKKLYSDMDFTVNLKTYNVIERE